MTLEKESFKMQKYSSNENLVQPNFYQEIQILISGTNISCLVSDHLLSFCVVNSKYNLSSFKNRFVLHVTKILTLMCE